MIMQIFWHRKEHWHSWHPYSDRDSDLSALQQRTWVVPQVMLQRFMQRQHFVSIKMRSEFNTWFSFSFFFLEALSTQSSHNSSVIYRVLFHCLEVTLLILLIFIYKTGNLKINVEKMSAQLQVKSCIRHKFKVLSKCSSAMLTQKLARRQSCTSNAA